MRDGEDKRDGLVHQLRILIGAAVGWASPMAGAAVNFAPLGLSSLLLPPPPPSTQGASGRHSGGELEPRENGDRQESEVGGCMHGLQAGTPVHTLAVGAGEWGWL